MSEAAGAGYYLLDLDLYKNGDVVYTSFFDRVWR